MIKLLLLDQGFALSLSDCSIYGIQSSYSFVDISISKNVFLNRNAFSHCASSSRLYNINIGDKDLISSCQIVEHCFSIYNYYIISKNALFSGDYINNISQCFYFGQSVINNISYSNYTNVKNFARYYITLSSYNKFLQMNQNDGQFVNIADGKHNYFALFEFNSTCNINMIGSQSLLFFEECIFQQSINSMSHPQVSFSNCLFETHAKHTFKLLCSPSKNIKSCLEKRPTVIIRRGFMSLVPLIA